MKIIKILAVFLFSYSYAQYSDTSYLKVSGGYEKNGFTGSIAYDKHINTNAFIRVGLEAQLEKYTFLNYKVPVKLGLFNVSYYQRLISFDREQLYNLHLGAGLIGGYEFINDGKEFLPNNEQLLIKSQFIYGGTAGVQMDIFLFESGRHADGGVFLVLEGNYNYFINSQVGTIQPNVKVGFKITI